MPFDSTAPTTRDPILSLHTDTHGQLLGIGLSGNVYVRSLLSGASVWSMFMVAPAMSRT